MSFDTLEYQVGDRPEAPQTLIVNRLGRARYTSHTNRETPDHPEMGIYETVLPTEEVGALVEMVARPSFRALPDHWGRVLSGDRYRRIRVVAGADTVEKFVGTRESVDSGLQAVLDRLDRVIGKVMLHPLQTLQMVLAEPVVDTDGRLTATIVLSVTGSQAVNVRHPIALLDAPDGWLSIQLWPDRPNASEMLNVAVDEVEDLRPQSERQDGGAFLEIPPRSSVAFRIHGSLSLQEAGPYLCRVSYVTFEDQIDNYRVLLGELLSQAVPMDVPVAHEVEEPR